MFKKPIAEAKHTIDTKNTEFNLMRWQKPIVYKN